jgi:hypothetical protein
MCGHKRLVFRVLCNYEFHDLYWTYITSKLPKIPSQHYHGNGYNNTHIINIIP